MQKSAYKFVDDLGWRYGTHRVGGELWLVRWNEPFKGFETLRRLNSIEADKLLEEFGIEEGGRRWMNDFLNEIVTCKACGKQEYYGDMHWGIHGQVCRECIYKEWETKDPNFSALGMPTFSNERGKEND